MAVLNANYLRARLRGRLPPAVRRRRRCTSASSPTATSQAHGVQTLDVAKRLLDYGFYAPTIYFPLVVKGALMIEPTETESKETLDEFVAAMLRDRRGGARPTPSSSARRRTRRGVGAPRRDARRAPPGPALAARRPRSRADVHGSGNIDFPPDRCVAVRGARAMSVLNTKVLVLNRSYLPVHITVGPAGALAALPGHRARGRRAVPDLRLRELGRPRRRGGLDRAGRPRDPRAARDPAADLRPGPAALRALQPVQHLRARPEPLPVLRPAVPARRAEPRPRRPALAGRHLGLGERRLLVPSLQSA